MTPLVASLLVGLAVGIGMLFGFIGTKVWLRWRTRRIQEAARRPQ